MKHVFLQLMSLPFLEVRTTLGSVTPYDAHFHMSFSVGVILEGRTRFFLDGAFHDAQKGDIVLVEPGRVHGCNPVDGLPRGYHMLFFDETWFADRVLIPGLGNGKFTLARHVITEPELYSEAAALVEAVRARSGTEDMCSGFLSAVLSHAGAALSADSSSGVAELQTALLPPEGGAACHTVSDLAEKAKMRRESFSRLFRRKTGLPPQSYLHCLRIEKGRRLLRQGKSISEAALETGYADQSHFHRMFTRIVSATPGCYRKNRLRLYKK